MHRRSNAAGVSPRAPRVLISCGEPSGDLYAGALTAALRELAPGTRVFGLGGDRLRERGAELVAHYRGLAATGLSEALAVVPRSYAVYRRLVTRARDERPDVFVAVDFPEINFRVAAAVRRLDIPVVYYIGPQLWAWRRRRIETMRRLVDLALVIFPFEEALYREAGIPVDFVGHPLLELSAPTGERAPFLRSLGLDPVAPTVALLPGSRPNELRAILPDVARAAHLVRARVPTVQFVVARAPNLDDALLTPVAPTRGQRRRGGGRRPYRRRPGRRRRGGDGVRNGDGPDRHPPAANGHRLPAVDPHVPPGQAVLARPPRRHGEPHRG